MKKRSLAIAVGPMASLLFAVSPAGAEGRNKPVWLVVTRPALARAIRPLAEERRKEGYEIVISTEPPAGAIGALDRPPAFILLVGDDQPGQENQPWYVPAKRRKLYRWRAVQPRTFASDAAWGDLNGDLAPDVPVGRIPVRTAGQAATVVKKILAFQRHQPTLDDLRLPIWAGTPGYDRVTDSLATGMLLGIVQANAPAWAQPWLLSGDPGHALCGWPPDQPTLFTGQLRRGGLFASLMGHGGAESWESMRFMGKVIEYTAKAAQDAFAKGEPAPPLAIFACGCGDFTRPQPCLAESLLLMPGGPVAAIAATTESHPLANAFSGIYLLEALGGTDRRLGSLWLAAQRKAGKARNFIIERLLRDVEGKLEENINVASLRRDQALMYAVLGDPATRLRLPGRLHGKLKRRTDGWHWQVHKPRGATRLSVGLRAAVYKYPGAAGQGKLQPDDARKKLLAANAALAFGPIATLDADRPWEGTIDKQGTLRLVATGPGQIHVAALTLRLPTTQPAAPSRSHPATGHRN